MHSSRMRTVRNGSRLPSGGVCTWSGGCTWYRRCTWSQRGVPGNGGCTWSGGVPAQVLPLVNRMTDRCKIITFASSLRMVTNYPFTRRISICVNISFKARLHVLSPSPSPSKFNIVSVVMDFLMHRLGSESILSVSVNLTVTGAEMVRLNGPLKLELRGLAPVYLDVKFLLQYATQKMLT